jgi:arylamine N-acetyltransferase
MGQCFPLPDDENVREAMQRHAENHEKIFNMYNFDLVPKPGSDMDKAQKLWDKKQVCCASRLLTCCGASHAVQRLVITV